MQKPLTVMRQETVDQIIKLINESGLPAFVLVDIFGSVTADLRQMAKKQYLQEKAAYEAAQTAEPTPEEVEE